MLPATWVQEHARLLPASGRALDVACGRGRHALWLAGRGLSVLAIDRDAEAVGAVFRTARARDLQLTAVVADLEGAHVPLSPRAFDVVVVVHYLHRPLFPALLAALRPGGLLIYETFTCEQAKRGKPTNPDFLLESGELRQLVEPLEILEYREGVFDDRQVASVVARNGPG